MTLDEESRSSLDFIEKEAARLSLLVNDIQLYLAAGTAGSPVRNADPAPVIAKLIPGFAPRLNDLGGRIETGSLPPVPLDPRRLETLFQVLLGNALEHAHVHRVGADHGREVLDAVEGTAALLAAERLQYLFDLQGGSR